MRVLKYYDYVIGVNHITFWMMTETFTGLKLKRHPGKFGSRPFCHIYTFCALPKGKVSNYLRLCTL